MVTVSSAFMSSRRERIIFRVLSASGCACKTTAGVDVLRFGKTDLDNTDVARDHFLSLYTGRRIRAPSDYSIECGVDALEIPELPAFSSGVMLSSYHPGSPARSTLGRISRRFQ